MTGDPGRKQSYSPLIAGVLSEIAYATAVGVLGIFVCAVVLLLSRVL